MFRTLLFLFHSFVTIVNGGYNDNIQFIQDHNSNQSSYEVGVNQFINRNYSNGSYPGMYSYLQKEDIPTIEIVSDKIKKSVDWRHEHIISSVKNQGECGSCWAFSATEAVEGIWALRHHKLYNLSEQELMDCSGYLGNNGCDGGSMENAFQYIIDHGICTNESYPYVATQNECSNSSCKPVVTIQSYSGIKKNNEKQLERFVEKQPVSVAIQANSQSFQLYKKGIYDDPTCGKELDHGVLLIGYGHDILNDMNYWIIKNSWGDQWGENGYMRLSRGENGKSGLCGIAMDPSIPLL